jgi:hypothetical protein
MSYVAAIPILVGSNYVAWRRQLDLTLLMLDIDTVMTSPCPSAPAALVREANETDDAFAARERDYVDVIAKHDLEKRKWEICNKKCLKIMQTKMSDAILGSVPQKNAAGVPYTAAEYLAIVESQHTGLIKQLVNMKYTGGGIREHILKMSNINAKLTAMKLVLPEEFLVHLVFVSLPQEYATFAVNYNSQEEKWNLQKLIDMCVQEEDMLSALHGGSLNYVQHNKNKRNFPNKNYKAKNQWESGPSNAQGKPHGKAPLQFDQSQRPQGKKEVAKDECLHCHKKGHW